MRRQEFARPFWWVLRLFFFDLTCLQRLALPSDFRRRLLVLARGILSLFALALFHDEPRISPQRHVMLRRGTEVLDDNNRRLAIDRDDVVEQLLGELVWNLGMFSVDPWAISYGTTQPPL